MFESVGMINYLRVSYMILGGGEVHAYTIKNEMFWYTP